jgi:hypothetical protein
MAKKIACLYNMNNIMAQTSSYLADLGHDVTLYLIDEYAHFHPYADSYKDLNYKIKQFPLKKTEIVTIKRDLLINEFGHYDYLIGIEYAPAIALRIGKCLNVFYSAATDLSDYPFSKYKYLTGKKWKTEEKYLAELQFKGIKNAIGISMNIAPLPIENALKKIEPKGKRFNALPYVYLKKWEDSESLKKSILKEKFDNIRAKYDILIFHHIRHEWGDNIDEVHKKGNNLILESLSFLIKKYKEKKIGLITFEYGTSVGNSRDLIKKLKLDNNVEWIGISNRKDYMYGISIADICVGQLYHNLITYTSCIEYITLKKPVIQWFNGELNNNEHHFFAINSQESLNETFVKIIDKLNTEFINLKTTAAYNWLIEDNVKKPILYIESDLNNSQNRNFRFIFFLELKFKFLLLMDKIIFKFIKNG